MNNTQKPVEENKLVLNVDEVAAILGVGRTAVYELVHREGFPVIRVGKRYLIPYARFIMWLNGQS